MKSQPFVTSALHKNFILSAASIILFFSNIVCAEQLTLETGKCYPKDVVNRSLKADGQQLLLNGNRHYYSKEQIDILGKQIIRTTTDGRKITALDSVRGIDSVLDDWDNSFAEMVKEGIAKQYEKEKVSKGYEAMGGESVSDDNSYYNGFFINSHGYGFNAEADQPGGKPSKKVCVRVLYKNPRFYNANDETIPNWAKEVTTPSDGISLAQAYKNGVRLVFVAQSYTVNSSGDEVIGKFVAVAEGTNKRAQLWAIDPSTGNSQKFFTLREYGITQYMADLINGKYRQ